MPLDVISEWKSFLPKKLYDKRDQIPRHKRMRWPTRKLSDIEGACIHQIAGGDNPVKTANYHIKYFFNGKGYGAPSVCYTYYIRKNGDIWWCNDMEAKTWSQGTRKVPGDENRAYVGIVLGGHFPGPGDQRGKDTPTFEQLLSLLELLKWLSYHLGFSWEDVYGHYDFGRAACPGTQVMNIIEAINKDKSLSGKTWGSKEWQYNLVRLNYSLGSYGPNTDGVDGKWGNKSKQALTKFQKDYGLPVSGARDKRTLSAMKKALRKKFGIDVKLT